jgi:hypothetical protein
MAAATVASLGGLALSGYQAYQGAQDKKRAQNDLDNYKRQELVNPYENMQISTLGTDFMKEQSQLTSSGLIDASRNAGIRGVYGMIPKIVSYNNNINREAQILLDDQVQKRNYAIANDEIAMRDIREGRDNANLAGIGQRLEVGRQDMWSGLRGMGAAANYGANNINFGSRTPQVEGLQPMSVSGNNLSMPSANLPKLKQGF